MFPYLFFRRREVNDHADTVAETSARWLMEFAARVSEQWQVLDPRTQVLQGISAQSNR